MPAAELPPATASEVPPTTGEEPPAAETSPPAPEPPQALATVPEPRVAALAEAAAQGEEVPWEDLAGLVDTSRGAAGDHAALAYGALLVGEERWNEVLAPLRRAAAGEVRPEYAALLFARAVVEGNLAGSVDEARGLIAPLAAAADTPVLAAEAGRRAFELEVRAGAWPEAARQGLELLAAMPPEATGPTVDETRWLTAEALRLAGRGEEARQLYETIWSLTPGSARASEARERLRAAGVEVAPPPAAERLAWIERMQGSGLHRQALAELAPLAAAAGDAELSRQARAAAAHSHYVLRENRRVVEVAESLRRDAPNSSQAARVALLAMRALGRDGRVAEIRAWEDWLRATHPDHEATAEARYYLAVILAGTSGEERAGLEILRDVAAGGGERAADALWRIAWIERRLGDDAAARSALDRLLDAETGAGYRNAALYWRARFAAPAERDRAIELYQTVRRQAPRDYYARAAEDRLRELGHEPPPLVAAGAVLPVPDPLADPARRPEPAYRRGVELAALGLPRLAAAELATLDLAGDPALALGVAHLHHRGGDTWSAIGLLLEHFADQLAGLPLDAPGVASEVWETLYPFPYQSTVRQLIRSANVVPPGVPIDPWLVATLARRESRFWRRAASPAGAVGVLQLMPETAARVARRVGMAPPDRPGLFDAETNLALGTAELAHLIAAFDGQWAPALAAYNAGEAAARKWWRARPAGQPLDEWIENIPYTETRLYVKWILGTHPIYRELYR